MQILALAVLLAAPPSLAPSSPAAVPTFPGPSSAPPSPQQRQEEAMQMIQEGKANLQQARAKMLGVPRYLFNKDGTLNPAIKGKPDPFETAPPFWQALNAWRRPKRPGMPAPAPASAP